MGPRLFSRGNSGERSGRELARLASMGPRLFSRGNAQAARAPVLRRRGFNGAAAFQPRKCGVPWVHPAILYTLQWGRGFSAAEIGLHLNGDEALWDASMGPRLFSRGNEFFPARDFPIAARFNGAAAFPPRKFVAPDSQGTPETGFNGAAAFQPRKSRAS